VTLQNITGRSAREIAASIEDLLEGGGFPTGEALPPIRRLARTLKVSPVTVTAAYRLLRHRGLVAGRGRQGTRLQAAAAPHVAGRVTSSDLVDLASGNPDPALLPPLDQVLRALPAEPVLYGEPLQLRALTAFAAGEFQADGIPAAAIGVTSGALDAIERILREHLRHGDRVAVEDPGFAPLLDLLRACGYLVEPFGVDDEGPEPEAFARAIRRAHAAVVTPRGQNPTGAALSRSRADALAGVLRAHPSLVVIENDPMSGLAIDPGVFLPDRDRRHWAVVRSTSKFLGPDVRLAVIAGDAATIARVQRRQAVGPRWVSHLLQRLALGLWSDPAAGRRLARAAGIYAQRREALLAALASHGIAARGRSGFNVWVPLVEETVVVQGLAECGWAVAPGERFRIDAPPGIRITTSALEPDDAARLAADLARLGRQPAAALA
jgi:DNA-binding transcriptional MocR family regulator